jgi:hypothetical protein
MSSSVGGRGLLRALDSPYLGENLSILVLTVPKPTCCQGCAGEHRLRAPKCRGDQVRRKGTCPPRAPSEGCWVKVQMKGNRMRRRVTMGLALVLPLAAYTLGASAQPIAKDKGSAPTASAPPSSSAAHAAAPATGGAAGAPSAVTVDMNAKPADTAMSGATYAVKLRDLEQRVDELKDQIRRSHTRLALLSDTIIGGGTAGSRAEVEFKNEMSSAFLLTRALFVIDGQIQYNRQDDSGALADQKDIAIYTGSVPPGDHTIQVGLTFQGNGYGVFSYLRGYKFE